MVEQEVKQSEELVEFKADGEESSVADPIATKSNKRKADKEQGDKAPLSMNTAGGPKLSKAQMISAMVGKQYESLSRMTASDLRDLYNTDANTSKDRIADKSGNGDPMIKLSVKEDVAEIFAGQEDLGEEFMTKAETIFEAAVAAKITTEVARLEEEFEQKLQEALEKQSEELAEQVDEYLSYATKEWVEENELAIESSIRSELAESFFAGLQQLFAEHYVDLPEDKVDLVAELNSKVAELEESLNAEAGKNFELSKHFFNLEKHVAIEEISEGLAQTQVAKLKALSEGIDADDIEEFKTKLLVVKENYFPDEKRVVVESSDEEPIEEEVQEVNSEMAAYLSAISRTLKK